MNWEKIREEGEIIKKDLSFSGLLSYLVEEHKTKENGTPFSMSDIEGYVGRKRLPEPLGGFFVLRNSNKYAKLYDLIENKSSMEELNEEIKEERKRKLIQTRQRNKLLKIINKVNEVQ